MSWHPKIQKLLGPGWNSIGNVYPMKEAGWVMARYEFGGRFSVRIFDDVFSEVSYLTEKKIFKSISMEIEELQQRIAYLHCTVGFQQNEFEFAFSRRVSLFPSNNYMVSLCFNY